MPINYQDRIVPDPKIAGGEAVIRGTRVTLRTVLIGQRIFTRRMPT